MGDIRRKADIGDELAKKRKKQDIKSRELMDIMKVDRADPNPNSRRTNDIEQRVKELKKINDDVKVIQGKLNYEIR